MIRIGIVGAGGISLTHTGVLSSMESVKLKCVADILPERAEKLARQYGAAAYTDYKKMICEEELDAVIVNLPHGLHRESAVFSAEQGLHIFVEKPMAVNSAECIEMMKAAADNKVKLMVGHVQRYFPQNIKAKELIGSGELGVPVMVTDIRNINYFNEDRPKWFLNKKMAGGGILMNYGAHSLDKLIWLTGCDVASAKGKTAQYLPGYDVEGNAQLLVEMENGVTAVISYSGYKAPWFNETVIYMTKGVIRLCTGVGLWVSKGDNYEEIMPENPQDPFYLQMADFISCISGNTEAPVSGTYGMRIIEVIEEVYRQNDKGLSFYVHKK